MEQKEQFRLLFKKLEEALKQHSIEDITNAVSEFLSKKTDKSQEINFVLDNVASDYGMTKRTLIHSNQRGQFSQARDVAYCVLYYNLGLPVRYISNSVIPRKSHVSVFNATKYFKSLNLEVKVDREFKEAYDRVSKKLAEFISNKNK